MTSKADETEQRELLRCNLNRNVQVVVTIFGNPLTVKTKDLDLLIQMLVETRNGWDQLIAED